MTEEPGLIAKQAGWVEGGWNCGLEKAFQGLFSHLSVFRQSENTRLIVFTPDLSCRPLHAAVASPSTQHTHRHFLKIAVWLPCARAETDVALPKNSDISRWGGVGGLFPPALRKKAHKLTQCLCTKLVCHLRHANLY